MALTLDAAKLWGAAGIAAAVAWALRAPVSSMWVVFAAAIILSGYGAVYLGIGYLFGFKQLVRRKRPTGP